MSKNFIASDAEELFLFDLEMEEATVNQGLAVNEETSEIYASQAYGGFNRSVESFIITRTSLGGKKKDSMTFKDGGHGTSFGVEHENGKTYIWTNMIDLASNGSITTQWLCRVPYSPGQTVTINSSTVQKILEFPDRKRYQTPIADSKNGLVALRITDTNSGQNTSEVEVYRMADLKKKVYNNVLYRYKFTNEMNRATLQGIAMDKNIVYLTFGQHADSFHLYCIDLEKGAVLDEINRPVGYAPDGEYIEGFGEPEGLFLYTNPHTGYKTLLTVIVGDAAGRRRQRLFAFSNNVGVQKFLGLAGESSQRVPITRADFKGKRINANKITSLNQIVEPGSYYLTTAEGDKMDDHPMKGVAGWWLYVSGGDTGNGCHQILARNSSVHADIFVRTSTTPKSKTSPWFRLNMTKA